MTSQPISSYPRSEKWPINDDLNIEGPSVSKSRTYRKYGKGILTLLLSCAAALLLVNYQLHPTYRIHATQELSTHTGEKRLIKLSPTHVEWIDEEALSYLLSLRDLRDHIKLNESISSHRDHLLRGVSTFAIEQLSQRDGYRVGYIDVTPQGSQDYTLYRNFDIKMPDYPTPNKTAHPELAGLFEKVSSNELKHIVTSLADLWTRYYKSTFADEASWWVYRYLAEQKWTSLGLDGNTGFNQKNVIARWAPPSVTSDEIVIIGAHLDSTSQIPYEEAPGADDDASGTATVMHIYSLLANSGIPFKYAIEAHLYAGEEGGLLGSDNVAKHYKKLGKKIRGMLDIEMVGWQPDKSDNRTTVTVLSDPEKDMSDYMIKVLNEYVKSDVKARQTPCGYGCSDHYSWYDQGYPVVCMASYGPKDKELNPYYHTSDDTPDKLDFVKMTEFAKAALAWVVEVAT